MKQQDIGIDLGTTSIIIATFAYPLANPVRNSFTSSSNCCL